MNTEPVYIVVPAHIARSAESIPNADAAKEFAAQMVARDRMPRVVLQVISTFQPTHQVRVNEQRFTETEVAP